MTLPKELNRKVQEEKHEPAVPWIAASELQQPRRPQSDAALDEVDEASMESFPCSDPPSYTHSHA